MWKEDEVGGRKSNDTGKLRVRGGGGGGEEWSKEARGQGWRNK